MSNPDTAHAPSPAGLSRRLLRSLGTTLVVILLCGVAALIAEGAASLYMFAHDVVAAQPPRDILRPHMQHDTLLGWVHRPEARVPNEYGVGIGLVTNQQSFRGARSVALKAATGIVRVTCSGDSFTLGYGVDDTHTWCARLEAEVPGLETINMGQVDYGLDQTYRWYMQDGEPLAPQVHILALNYLQLERALSTSTNGRPKTHLELNGTRAVVAGAPVAAPSSGSFRRATAARVFGDVSIVQWFQHFGRFSPMQRTQRDIEAKWPMFEAVLASLANVHRKRGSALVLVYLPTRQEVSAGVLDKPRQLVATSAAKLGISFIDLTPPLRALPADSSDNAFILATPSGAAPDIAGHYSNLGHLWVARQVAQALARAPKSSARELLRLQLAARQFNALR